MHQETRIRHKVKTCANNYNKERSTRAIGNTGMGTKSTAHAYQQWLNNDSNESPVQSTEIDGNSDCRSLASENMPRAASTDWALLRTSICTRALASDVQARRRGEPPSAGWRFDCKESHNIRRRRRPAAKAAEVTPRLHYASLRCPFGRRVEVHFMCEFLCPPSGHRTPPLDRSRIARGRYCNPTGEVTLSCSDSTRARPT